MKHQPSLVRLPFALDDVLCTILDVHSRDGVVSTCLSVPPTLGARFLRAGLHPLLRTSACPCVALRL